jgi:ketosteroid isomerase-like protein
MADGRERARKPEDLPRFFVERANAGDAGGLAALYEADAVLALPSGEVAAGREEILASYERLLAKKPRFEPGEQFPALVSGDLALTSTRLKGGGVTVEVARRQPDGTWLWVIDQPNIAG